MLVLFAVVASLNSSVSIVVDEVPLRDHTQRTRRVVERFMDAIETGIKNTDHHAGAGIAARVQAGDIDLRQLRFGRAVTDAGGPSFRWRHFLFVLPTSATASNRFHVCDIRQPAQCFDLLWRCHGADCAQPTTLRAQLSTGAGHGGGACCWHRNVVNIKESRQCASKRAAREGARRECGVGDGGWRGAVVLEEHPHWCRRVGGASGRTSEADLQEAADCKCEDRHAGIWLPGCAAVASQ